MISEEKNALVSSFFTELNILYRLWRFVVSVRVGVHLTVGKGFMEPVKDVGNLFQLSSIRLVAMTEANCWTTDNDQLVLNQTSSLLQQTWKIHRSVAESEERP